MGMELMEGEGVQWGRRWIGEGEEVEWGRSWMEGKGVEWGRSWSRGGEVERRAKGRIGERKEGENGRDR